MKNEKNPIKLLKNRIGWLFIVSLITTIVSYLLYI